jgi:hypothetical protein
VRELADAKRRNCGDAPSADRRIEYRRHLLAALLAAIARRGITMKRMSDLRPMPYADRLLEPPSKLEWLLIAAIEVVVGGGVLTGYSALRGSWSRQR